MTARHVFYTGRVQGVGFRYSTKRIASGFDVTGWVKNLPDGRVELFSQAFDADEVEAFLEDIQRSSLGSHIKEIEVQVAAADTSLRGFNIVRD
ncbi:MAG: acylphosphatase [Prosthecobacter sp.]|jgi:acylphosphatase|uniref:acylphosphatase n=1 Tax=Prosthecobacter sp. TaxID=1965333 RepID=UPI0019FB2B34|nr:acylphosphatase [Prosthecobacter sp.]MBE2285338.1 acylphosphatase [Prosthecobacter sp.]